MIVIFAFIEEVFIESNKSPVLQFSLVNAKSKIYFSNGMIYDSITQIKLTDKVLIINKDTMLLNYQYWYYGNPHTLSFTSGENIIQYKSIGYNKPHSIDVYKNIDGVLVNEQWIF